MLVEESKAGCDMAEIIDLTKALKAKDERLFNRAAALLSDLPPECIKKIVRSLERQAAEDRDNGQLTERRDK